MSVQDRQLVNNHLKEKYYTFWRFAHIFFHSGCREVELLGLTYENVNLQERWFKVLVKKGTSYRLDKRAIEPAVVKLWEEIVNDAEKLLQGAKTNPNFTENKLPNKSKATRMLYIFSEAPVLIGMVRFFDASPKARNVASEYADSVKSHTKPHRDFRQGCHEYNRQKREGCPGFAAKDKENNAKDPKQFVAVSEFCNDIGLSEKEVKIFLIVRNYTSIMVMILILSLSSKTCQNDHFVLSFPKNTSFISVFPKR